MLFLSKPAVLAVACASATSWVQAQTVGTLAPTIPVTALQSSAPGTAVPAVLYRSVFVDLPKGIENASVDWKSANARVAQFPRGHADLLRWETEQARTPAQPTHPAMACCKGPSP